MKYMLVSLDVNWLITNAPLKKNFSIILKRILTNKETSITLSKQSVMKLFRWC